LRHEGNGGERREELGGRERGREGKGGWEREGKRGSWGISPWLWGIDVPGAQCRATLLIAPYTLTTTPHCHLCCNVCVVVGIVNSY